MRRWVVAITSATLYATLALACSSNPSQPSQSAFGVPTAPGTSVLFPEMVSAGGTAPTSWACLASSLSPWETAGCNHHERRILQLTTGAAPLSAPLPPISLTGATSGNRVILAWLAPAGGDPVVSYVVEAGSSSGASDLANSDLGSATPSLTADGVPNGTYFIRIRAKNEAGLSAPSNEIVLTVGGGARCASAPSAPFGLVGNVVGSTVNFAWSSASGTCAPTAYIVEVGTGPGLTNLASINTGTTTTTFSASGVGAGTYYFRVRAVNSVGPGPASNEIVLIVGTPGPAPCAGPPAAPSGLITFAIGTTVTLIWTGSAGATSYIIEAGSAPTLANLVVSDTGSTATSLVATAGPGTYYVRIRAKSACGTSAPSNESVLVVALAGPAPTPPPTPTPGLTCNGASVPSIVDCPNNAGRQAPTARCNDGTYSCSQNRSGTCSSHLGVSCYVCPGPLC